jgi:hypothetical protein
MYLTRFVIPDGGHKASRPAASPALAVVAAWSEKPPSAATRFVIPEGGHRALV